MDDNVSQCIENGRISYDILFEVLSHERRRYALYCLEEHRTPMALADLADEVTRLEYDARTLSEVSEDAVKRIYCDLYHSHIPKMEEADLLGYSQERDAVSLRYSVSDLNLGGMIRLPDSEEVQ